MRAQPSQSPLSFTNYTVDDGLPTNTINQILQDCRGFIWLATSQGLARFDGTNFITIKPQDSSFYPFQNIDAIAEINNHELLVNSNKSILLINSITGRYQWAPAFWKNKIIYYLLPLRKNLLSFITPGKIYFADDNLTATDSIALSKFPNGVRDILFLGNDRVLLQVRNPTKDEYFDYSLRTKKIELLNLPAFSKNSKNNYFLKFADSVNRILYVNNYKEGGIHEGAFAISYDEKKTGYLQPAFIEGSNLYGAINSISNFDSLLFINAEYGLTIKKMPGKPHYYANATIGKSILQSPGSFFTMQDKGGNFWTTSAAGLSNFNLKQNNYLFWKLPEISPMPVEKFVRFDNKIWMCNESNGSMYLDVQSKQIYVLDSAIINYCWGIKTVNGNLFIYGNSNKGKYVNPQFNTKLLIYDGGTHHLSAPQFLKKYTDSAELITLIHPAKNGDVWYSINRGGGLVRQQGNTFTHYTYKDKPAPFTFRYLNVAAEDGRGNIYFSVNKGGGLLVWKNEQQRFETWPLDSLLHSPVKFNAPIITHIIDGRQNLWISMQQVGLIKYNVITGEGKWYNMMDGLQSNQVESLINDEQDNIWIATEKGLNCYLSATGRIVNFTQNDGLPFTNMSRAYIYFDNADTSLYISNEGYLYKLKTHELLNSKRQSTATLFVDGMYVNAKPYYFTDEKNISLQPGEDNLQFSFVLLDLEHSITNRNFEYQLSRNDEKADWQKLNGTNTIAFTSLRAGTYTLLVRILNDATGNYIYGSNPFHFTIAMHWYNTWWFITLCFLAGIWVTWAFIRLYYRRRFEKQEALLEKEKALVAERTRIAADMHDDLGAGLSRIRYMSAGIKNEIKDETLRSQFNKIISGSDELVDKMNEIIWALNSNDERLEDVLYYIRSQCSEMLDHADIELETTMPEIIPEKILNSEQKRNLFLVVKEAIHNIIKHAQARHVTLFMQAGPALVIEITDNGTGFDPEASRLKGNGLGNFEKRMRQLNGMVQIQSVPGCTKVRFEISL